MMERLRLRVALKPYLTGFAAGLPLWAIGCGIAGSETGSNDPDLTPSTTATTAAAENTPDAAEASNPGVDAQAPQPNTDAAPVPAALDAGAVTAGQASLVSSSTLTDAAAPSDTFDAAPGHGTPFGDHDFTRGARVVIPPEVFTAVTLDLGGSFPPQARPLSTWQLLEDENLPRQYEFHIAHNYLYSDVDPTTGEGVRCRPYPGLLDGHFEVDDVEVHEDRNESGAQLNVVKDGDHYQLTHDGIGSHELVVRGTFIADDATLCPNVTDEEGRVALEFTTIVEIVRAASVVTRLDLECGEHPVMISGRGFPGLDLQLFNAGGLFLTPHNLGSVPTELVIETEKTAKIAGTDALWRDGITVTGEHQRVRLSTKFGTLAEYEVVELGEVDGWDVEFWSAEALSWKVEQIPVIPDANSPVTCSGPVLGANAQVKVGQRGICSPIFVSDFDVVESTPETCEVGLHDTDLGFPGALTTLSGEGLCELDLLFPAANHGHGLRAHLAANFVAE